MLSRQGDYHGTGVLRCISCLLPPRDYVCTRLGAGSLDLRREGSELGTGRDLRLGVESSPD